MPLCKVCITETNYKSICGCNICLDCILNWFGEKNRNVQIDKFACPIQQCDYVYTLADLMEQCKQQPYQTQLQAILVKQYLKGSDIRPCPNNQCNNFGYVDLKQLCDDLLECQACGMKWKDLQVSSYTYQLENALTNAFGSIKDFIYCFATANECPNCGVLIQRSGGCKHMTCKACNGQFCWQCKQNWVFHKPAQCFSQLLVFIGLSISFSLNLLYIIGALHYFLYLIYPIKWTFILILTNFMPLGIFISGYQLLPFIYLKFIGRRQQGFWDFVLSIGAVALLFIDYFVYDKLGYWFDVELWDIAKILFIEVILVIIVICFYQRTIFHRLSLFLIAGSLIYFFGVNGLGIAIWLLPLCADFIDGYVFKIISYSILIFWNIFELEVLLTSYFFIPMIVIDIMLQRKGHRFRFLNSIFYYTGIQRRRVII